VSRRAVMAALVLVVAVALAVLGANSVRSHTRGDGVRASSEAANGDAGRAGSEEADDEEAVTAERLEALAKAKANGTFGGGAATTNPANGWVGSRLLNAPTDDWEPAVAADPSAPYVYLLTTRYGTDAPGCAKQCPQPFIAMTTSADGGSTWSEQDALCPCLGSKGQFDPTIEVVPSTGAVYSVFMNGDRHDGFSAVFTKSVDHGATWTAPVHVYGNVSWTDKPEVATSASGKDIYVSWNGPQGGDLYVGQSHDFGSTWTQQKLSDSKRYYYAYDARVMADGTVVFSESSIVYSGATKVEGEVWHHAVISRDNGATWEDHVVAKVPVGEECVAEGCNPDFYIGQTSVVSDASDHLVLAYEGPTVASGPQRVYVATSSDGGRTWSAGIPLSAAGENATQPRLASSGGGNVRLWYMQTAEDDNPDAWNVWYRSSSNGGRSWSSPVKLDDASADDGNPGYINASGFDEIYGDYGEIAVTSAGKTFATWGEGFSYTGPGGTWFNLQR
jgi:BNR repeat protein